MTIYIGLLLATLAALVVARIVLDQELKQVPPHNVVSLGEIRPAELSYLANDGDIFDVLTVMSVDLLQRVVKGKMSGAATPDILDYEERMWQMTRDFVSETASKTIEHYKPDKIAEDPIGYVKRVGKLYEAIVRMVRLFAGEIISDPRRIRKYFSFGWIVRLALDFSTSSYRDRFRQELKDHLVERGLLVTPEKIIARSKIYLAAAIFFFLVSFTLALISYPLKVAIMLIIAATLTTVSLRSAILIGSFLPFYAELGNIIGFISRKDWRISTLRTILYSVTGVAVLTLVLIFVAGSIAGWALLELFLHEIAFDKLIFLFLLTLAFFASSDLLFRGIFIRNNTIATALGEEQLNLKRAALAKLGPFVSFKQMLSSEGYDPTFSEIVAIYGVEPLIFLA